MPFLSIKLSKTRKEITFKWFWNFKRTLLSIQDLSGGPKAILWCFMVLKYLNVFPMNRPLLLREFFKNWNFQRIMWRWTRWVFFWVWDDFYMWSCLIHDEWITFLFKYIVYTCRGIFTSVFLSEVCTAYVCFMNKIYRRVQTRCWAKLELVELEMNV